MRADCPAGCGGGWTVGGDTAIDDPIVPLLSYQTEAVTSAARFLWCCWSRQTGKSFALSLRRVLRGLKRRRNQLILSAGQRQSIEVMQKVRQHCQALRIVADTADKSLLADMRLTQCEIALPGGVRIIALPANPTTVRGFTGDVFLDEFAMHRDDRAIWAAMFPALLRGQGELDVASTPKGPDNLFAKLATNRRFEHSTVTLPQAIDVGLDADADAIREAMGDDQLYRQEFLCEFLDESNALLPYALIASCEDAALGKTVDLSALATVEDDLFVGVDIGRRRDLTVIWVWRLGSDGVGVTAGVIELAGAPFREQADAIAEVMSLPGVRRCCIDEGGLGMQLAEQTAERFGRHRVEPVRFSVGLKQQLAGLMRIKLEHRQVRLPVDEAIRNDFHSVRRSVTAGGQVRYEADRTAAGHGDRFWSACLGLHAAESAGSGQVEYISAGPLRFGRRAGR
jgi:phage FluMu gp28-like protein